MNLVDVVAVLVGTFTRANEKAKPSPAQWRVIEIRRDEFVVKTATQKFRITVKEEP